MAKYTITPVTSLPRGEGISFTETDDGTKEQCKRAIKKTARELDRKFKEAMIIYWQKVYDDARALCPVDTGTLYATIRIIIEAPTGQHYQVVASPRGVQVTGMITAGGMLINPRTGEICDYAQAVHDGTRYMEARPFLTEAIMLNEIFLQQLLAKNIDEGLGEFGGMY